MLHLLTFLMIMAILPDPEKLLTELAAPVIMRRVVASVDPRHRPADFKPANLLVIVGGGKGAGKSVLAGLVAEALGEEGIKRKYVAEIGSSLLDDVFALPGMGKLRPFFDTHAKAMAKGTEESMIARIGGELFSRARTQAYKQGSPIVIDYHMDDPAVVRKLVKEAKDNAYETMFATVSVNPQTALERIAQREVRTGRRTDAQEALRTHQRVATELPGYHGLFDVGIVFDNNSHYPRLIAKSVGGKVTLLDGEAYEQATAIGREARQAGRDAGGQTHEHHTAAVAGSHASGAAAGGEPARQRGFAERIADRLEHRQPPVRL